MLKFLTHKLKSHSLNEEQLNQYKVDEDRDSGTESDGEEADSVMESETERSSCSTGTPAPTPAPATSACSPYFLDSALPSDTDHNYDNHSSEEELEVINSSSHCSNNNIKELLLTTSSRCGSVTVPEKRKWSQITRESGGSGGGGGVGGGGDGGGGGGSGNPKCDRERERTPCGSAVLAASAELSSGSSDEEVQGLLASMATPVQFRTSPPLTAHKPGHKSLSPPPKLFHYGGGGGGGAATLDVSPRKRHRHTPRPHHIQRPCLDFEKMQQLKARAVTAWRHGGDHNGELSVFCW